MVRGENGRTVKGVGAKPLQKNQLGKTSVEISHLGLGTVKFGRNRGLRYRPFDLPSLEHLKTLIETAEALGINYLDTAAAYGEGERLIGQLLQGNRDRWVISTKAGEIFVDGKSYYEASPDQIEKSLMQSLAMLNTDFVDIFLLHCDPLDDQLLRNEGLIRRLQSFKERGLVRAIGASTNTIQGGLFAVSELDCVMVTYNTFYRDQGAVIKNANRLGKGVLIKKPLNCGLLSDASSALKFCQSTATHSILVGTINTENLRANAAVFQ